MENVKHNLELLVSEQEMNNHVIRVAREIDEAYAGRPFTMLILLEGARYFSDQLRPHIRSLYHTEYVKISSYHGDSSTGQISCMNDFSAIPQDKPVLIVDDVLDTGLTINYVIKALQAQGVTDIKSAFAVDKPLGRKAPHTGDFSCITLPQVFLVGFGMDYNGEYRDLSSIFYLDISPHS